MDARALREARRTAGLTQEEVARRLGTTQSAIARWERGAVTPSLDAAVRFATAVGAEITLVRDEDHLEPEERATLQMNLRLSPAERVSRLTTGVRFALAGREALADARRDA